MGIENRKHSRHAFRARLQIEPVRPRGSSTAGRAINVSLGGLCYEQPVPASAEDEIRIRVAFEAGVDLTFKARVRHATKIATEVGGLELDPIWLVGVQFIELTDSQQKQIAQLVGAARTREQAESDRGDPG